ncbi:MULTISPECIES: putative quinol monooxygenase [Enterobacter]|uniref:putative quinol monooxygenase n=1 Tax=Enterobacter TaxID=547 RepID=UPI001BDE6D2C|nr:putative quinol monooxygenase [Enterobacter asburiae]MBT1866616.1 antibiotic biosynthesis monooxygenase [Enterobacter asburiae]MBT1893700.1 antibiotic biosynthesis monooxygenase [Enterobacter asburiae]
MIKSETISLLAVLKASPGKVETLKHALQALLVPTRQEAENIEYQLFQLRDAPDCFYVRESWKSQKGLEDHVSLPHFQSFLVQSEYLLAEPLRLDYLTRIEP